MTNQQRQNLLSYLGYDTGGADGIWGEKSRQAAAAFQREWGGLSVDGIAGEETEKALKEAVARDWVRQPGQADAFWPDIRYFTQEEFRCKCGGKYCGGYPARMREEAVRIADAARSRFGAPGHVVSGLRCPEWNRQQGGVEDSRHRYGEAVDLRIEGVSARRLLDFLQTQPIRYAYAINETNVHFDIPKGVR